MFLYKKIRGKDVFFSHGKPCLGVILALIVLFYVQRFHLQSRVQFLLVSAMPCTYQMYNSYSLREVFLSWYLV